MAENKTPVCAQQVQPALSMLFTVWSVTAVRLHLGSGVHSLVCIAWASTNELFSFRDVHMEHTQAQICRSYLISRFLPSASMQPYLDTNEHVPIFCAGISRSAPFIWANQSCDNRNFIFQGREKGRKCEINSSHSPQKLQAMLNMCLSSSLFAERRNSHYKLFCSVLNSIYPSHTFNVKLWLNKRNKEQ